MKKNILKKIGGVVLITFSIASSVAFANSVDFGANGVDEKSNYKLEEMLKFAVEDECLAYAEYEAIINKFGSDRPFSNIIKAEEKHIEELKELYKNYNLQFPVVDPSKEVIVPETIEEAFEAGVKAEKANIAMYEKFLDSEIPDDVRAVFEELKRASESHLQAFTRNASSERGFRRSDNNTMGNGRMYNQSGQGKGYGNRNNEERLYRNQKEDCDGDCENCEIEVE